MNTIYTNLTLDFSMNKSLQTVPIKQYDAGGRVLRVALTDNGQELTLSSENTVLLYASVGNTVTALAKPLGKSDNKILIPITSELTAIAGVEHCEIRVYNNSGFLHTAQFNLHVGKASADTTMPQVIVTADIVDQISDIDVQTGTYIRNMIELEHFRDTRILVSAAAESSTSSLMGNPPVITVANSQYNPIRDWLFMFKNNHVFVMENAYSIDTTTIVDGVRIVFDNTKMSFEIGDTLDVLIFKPFQPDLYQCTESEYAQIANPDSETVYVLIADEDEEAEP